MASLLDLPSELMDVVLAGHSTSTISKLSRTCRAFHAFLTPRVYKVVDWFWADHAEPPPIHLLLRTLLRNPARCRHIQTLRLRGGGVVAMDMYMKDSPWPYELYKPTHNCYRSNDPWQPIERARSIPLASTFSPSDVQIVENILHVIYRPVLSIWLREFVRGNVDVIVALLLSRLNSLATLDIGYAYIYHAQFIPAILRHRIMDNDTPQFEFLQSVAFALDKPDMDFHPWFDLDLLRAFLVLPRLELYKGTFPEPVIFSWPGITPQSMSLTTLLLIDCGVLEKTLGAILESTPALRHLTYEQLRIPYDGTGFNRQEHWKEVYSRVDETTLNDRCRSLNSALSKVRGTLQSLVLRHYEYFHKIDFRVEDITPYGMRNRLTVLKDMVSLASLELPWAHLFGFRWDICGDLPEPLGSSWRRLCIRGLFHRHTIPWKSNITIEQFAQVLQSHPFSKLETIIFVDTQQCYWEELQNICTNLNIDCDFYEK
jgi:hypothetical protein